MDLKQIKELMKAMQGTGTKHLEMTTQGGFKLVLEQHQESRPFVAAVQENDLFKQELAAHRADMVLSRHNLPSQQPTSEDLTSLEEPSVPSKFITSPMVGTFYLASSPETPPFAKVGEKVEKDTVICIIEAMKVMNEVKAGVAGTVVEILVENGHPIEFGTKLFRIT